jgi:hypothetical protein
MEMILGMEFLLAEFISPLVDIWFRPYWGYERVAGNLLMEYYAWLQIVARLNEVHGFCGRTALGCLSTGGLQVFSHTM